MKAAKTYDLETVRAEIENWRVHRKSRGRIPEKFWKAASELLKAHPFTKVCRTLKLDPKQFRKRLNSSGNGISTQRQQSPSPSFLELSDHELSKSIRIAQQPPDQPTIALSSPVCRVTIERVDGSKISLTLPMDWMNIQMLCASFLQL